MTVQLTQIIIVYLLQIYVDLLLSVVGDTLKCAPEWLGIQVQFFQAVRFSKCLFSVGNLPLKFGISTRLKLMFQKMVTSM